MSPVLEDVDSQTPYLWQVARAYRFFKRYRDAREAGMARVDESFNDVEDFMWAFFQNAWHIKDWLKNDPSLTPDQKAAISTEVHATESILLCADLANGSKHFGTDSSRDKIGARDQSIQLSINENRQLISDHMIVTGNGRRMTALELSRWILNDWRDLLVRHRLLDDSTERV